MGQLTINSYEQGKSVPDSTNRLLLQLADEPIIFCEMYKHNKYKIGNIQRERIESSKEYKNCMSWGGIEGLYVNLSVLERNRIENITSSSDCVVSTTVANMVKDELKRPDMKLYKESEDSK